MENSTYMEPYLKSYIKMNSKWIRGLNIKDKTINLLKRHRKKSSSAWIPYRFLGTNIAQIIKNLMKRNSSKFKTSVLKNIIKKMKIK